MLYTYGPSPALYAEADPDPSDPTAVPPRLVGVSIPVRNAATGADLPAATTSPGGYITYSIADVPAIQIQTKTWNSGTSSYDDAWITEYANETKASWDNAADLAQQASTDAAAAQSTAQEALGLAQSEGARSVNGVGPDGTGNIFLTPGNIGAFAANGILPAAQVSGLATVAKSGSFNDLADRPPVAIPLSQKGTAGGVASLDLAGNVLDGSGNPVTGGSGGTSGPVTSADITDATTLGRSLLTAASAATARTAIGAGTSSLALGSTASTAKAGSWKPATNDITDATAIGKALLQASTQTVARTAIGALPTTIGSTATSSVVVVANGAAAPAGLPDGTLIVEKSA